MGKHPMSASAEERLEQGPTTGSISVDLTDREAAGACGAIRWLLQGLENFINDGPTRRGVAKILMELDEVTDRNFPHRRGE